MEHTKNTIERHASLDQLAQDALHLIDGSVPANTRRAYSSDWSHFQEWCESHGLTSLPAEPSTVVLYLTEQSKSCKVSTIQRRLASISLAHETRSVKSPTKSAEVKLTIRAIRRQLGVAQKGKDPLMLEDLRRLIASTPQNAIGARDRAIISLGFLGAFRRSELTSLMVEDVSFTDRGLLVSVRRAKNDQEGQGAVKALPKARDRQMCPYENLKAWIELAGLESGPLFRRIDKGRKVAEDALTPQSIALVIKKYATKAGLNPDGLAGHSLRVGFVTEAALRGASERAIMNVTGHRTRSMVDRYVRRADPWTDNAANSINL